MAPRLKTQLALVALLGIFLIPLVFSSLNGLKHVLTCHHRFGNAVTVEVPARGLPTIGGSRGAVRVDGDPMCEGLQPSMVVRPDGERFVSVEFPIANRSVHTWRASVRLRVGNTSVPVDVGAIAAGTTGQATVRVRLETGKVVVRAELLAGP